MARIHVTKYYSMRHLLTISRMTIQSKPNGPEASCHNNPTLLPCRSCIPKSLYPQSRIQLVVVAQAWFLFIGPREVTTNGFRQLLDLRIHGIH